jgi:hypothetical protein
LQAIVEKVKMGHERNCIAKIVLSHFAVPEQLSRLIVSTGFLDHDPIGHRGAFGFGCTGFRK